MLATTRFKLILFGCSFAIGIIIGFEVMLRLASFSFFPPDYGQEGRVRTIFTSNEKEFFVRPEYANLTQTSFLKKKPSNVWRAVIVGESTVGMFGRMDEFTETLQKQTSKTVQLINFGIASYGSVRLLYHFPEIIAFQPDLIVIYIGHNEFEEELALDLHQKKTWKSMIRLWLQENSRTVQLVSKALFSIGNQLLAAQLQSLETRGTPLISDDVRLSTVVYQDKKNIYERYKRNLENMLLIARGNKIPVLISTVAYNRRSHPFTPAINPNFDKANEYFSRGDFAEAKKWFEFSQDQDESPHHANATVNSLIRSVAKEMNVPLLDADQLVVEAAPHHIPGYEMFDDHCHLAFKRWLPALQQWMANKIVAEKLIPLTDRAQK